MAKLKLQVVMATRRDEEYEEKKNLPQLQ